MKTLYEDLAELLNVDVAEISKEKKLRDFEDWDSVTVLSLVALIDSRHGFSLGSNDLKEIQTVGELEALILLRKKTA
jgi:acyl carrier protein